jgi:oligopeptide/dipeptide ABC transporter ATP-binding protein
VRSLLEVRNLKKHFPVTRGLFRRTVGHVRAVDGVSFSILRGETVGLVGESGSGKSTIGRCIARLIEPTAGQVLYRAGDGQVVDLPALPLREMKRLKREIQILFQDPNSALNPRMTVRQIISEPLEAHGFSVEERSRRVHDYAALVGLRTEQLDGFPHQFSGGQKQRIGIARALVLHPSLLISDEPTSALDVSIQAQILGLLMRLREELDLTMLFIAHDLSVVEHISDRIIVLYLGKVCEVSPSDVMFEHPAHPYTEALIAAIPRGRRRDQKEKLVVRGTIPDPAHPPSGCVFHTRCRYATAICRVEEPGLRPASDPGRGLGAGDHDGRSASALVACHRYGQIPLKGYSGEKDTP